MSPGFADNNTPQRWTDAAYGGNDGIFGLCEQLCHFCIYLRKLIFHKFNLLYELFDFKGKRIDGIGNAYGILSSSLNKLRFFPAISAAAGFQNKIGEFGGGNFGKLIRCRVLFQ